ncbi:MAG: hypothetical protein GEU73_02990 [Chloroflexi bacterium]|nr:hypothetical protein [Chloroflexota bacterium]
MTDLSATSQPPGGLSSSSDVSDAIRERISETMAAAAAGDRATASRLITALADADPTPSGEVLEGLAFSLYSISAWMESSRVMELAFRAFLQEGSRREAVQTAIFLVGVLQSVGEHATSRGWERRAVRLLEQVGPCVERGYLALARVGCDVDDPRELVDRATIAESIAREFGDHELELRAFADKGLGLIRQGYVDAGFALLDEVMVAIAAGEVHDSVTRSLITCALLTACECTGDLGRADYWLRRIEQDRLHESEVISAHCGLVYGVIEALRGRWEMAEARLQATIRSTAPWVYSRVRAPMLLAELYILRGRYGEAAEILGGFEHELEAVPAVARLRLVEGDYGKAAALLRSATRGLGENCMRLAPVLALLVEVELRRGDSASAGRAAERLVALEERCESNEIRAMARLGAGRITLHDGDPWAAIEEMETALTLLIHQHRPMLTAQIRLELARALARANDPASAGVEAEAALAAFRKLGLVPDATSAEQVLNELATDGEAAPAHTNGGGSGVARQLVGGVESLTRRESEIAKLVADGLTNREIADRLVVSVRTVETHVDRILGKLDFHTRTHLAAWVHARPKG